MFMFLYSDFIKPLKYAGFLPDINITGMAPSFN